MQPPTPQPHQLTTQADGRLYCPVCRWSWARGPLSACPGVPRYNWVDRPASLRTRDELRAAGRNPGGPPGGAVARHGFTWYWLYDEAASVPRRPLTEKQIAAVERRKAERERQREEARLLALRAEQEARAREEAEVSAWARRMLATPDACILDTETTGLAGRPVAIAVLDLAGQVLLDTLCDPEIASEPGALAIHGLTPQKLAGAPTFPAVYPHLVELLAGRTVVVYNADFDSRILRWTCHSYQLPEIAVAGWEDAMEEYAVWVGEWSDYHQSYRWQPLPGGDHTALGDCRATLRLLERMAESAAEVPDVVLP